MPDMDYDDLEYEPPLCFRPEGVHYWTPRHREPIPPEKRTGVTEIAKKWGISARRVLQLCKAGKVYAAKMVDGKWSIPKNAEKPVDGAGKRITKNFDETDDEDKVLFAYDEAALRKPKEWDAHINSRLDSTVFASVFAKAVRRSCRLGFQ